MQLLEALVVGPVNPHLAISVEQVKEVELSQQAFTYSLHVPYAAQLPHQGRKGNGWPWLQ